MSENNMRDARSILDRTAQSPRDRALGKMRQHEGHEPVLEAALHVLLPRLPLDQVGRERLRGKPRREARDGLTGSVAEDGIVPRVELVAVHDDVLRVTGLHAILVRGDQHNAILDLDVRIHLAKRGGQTRSLNVQVVVADDPRVTVALAKAGLHG